MPVPVPVPPVPDALPPELLEGVTPMPAELLDFQDRLHELAGDFPTPGPAASRTGTPTSSSAGTATRRPMCSPW